MSETTPISASTDARTTSIRVSVGLVRRLPWAVLGSFVGVSVVLVLVIVGAGRPEWWPCLAAGGIVGGVCALASVVIILSSAGKPAEYVVTMVMLLAAVRIGISLIGLLVSVLALDLPRNPTALMICGYYAATLIVESFLVRQAVHSGSPAMTDTLQGNQG